MFGYRPIRAGLLALALPLAVGCLDEGTPTAYDPAVGPACNRAGHALATQLNGERIHFDGPHAVGGAGDALLINDHAAYVIQGVDRGITYYHYGGILVDAVTVDRCEQTTLDQFEELGLLVAQLQFDSVLSSALRAFRAETVEVLQDGRTGGPAIVRATGTDDYYWLVEYTLISLAVNNDQDKELSDPFGLRIQVDYILPPDSPVLEIEVRLINEAGRELELLVAGEIVFGDETEAHRFAASSIEFEGFAFATGVPWLTARATTGPGAYSLAMDAGVMAGGTISGVEAILDLDQVLKQPLELKGAGATATTRFRFAAGPTDGHSAAAPLAASQGFDYLDEPVDRRPLRGVVRTAAGAPAAGARVRLEARSDGVWQTLDSYTTNADGRFGPGRLELTDDERPVRFVAETPGTGAADPVTPAAGATTVTLTLPAPGELRYAVTGDGGVDLPAKLSLFQGDTRTHRFFIWGGGSEPVPPGTYEVWVSRGYEYSLYSEVVTVPAGGHATVEARLDHVVDTSGFLSIDTHVHSGPSADSKVPLDLRIRNAAAEGLEIPVATDHEAIVGLQAGIEATGLGGWVRTITGEEVTASMPEHLTMFPVEPDGTLRGGIIEWYRLGLPELYDAMHERGADIAMINHPGTLYELLEWDRVAGWPAVSDYDKLQMTKSEAPWSWDFEGIEVLNGARNPFRTDDDPSWEGGFDNWMSFHNHGHRILGVAASDAHGLEDLGMPRSYFAAPSDDVRDFRVQDAVDAFLAGQVVMSAGAFARVAAGAEAAGPGELATTGGDGIDLTVHLTALPEIDLTHFRVYANCDQVLRVDTTDPEGLIKFSGSVTVPVARDAHLVLAAFGADPMPPAFHGYEPTNVPRVMTNPIYVDTDGDGDWDAPGGKECDYQLD